MRLRVEVAGAGVIASVIQWESVAYLNGAGRYSFSMPASDPAAAWLQPLATVYCYWGDLLVGAGTVEQVTVASRGMLQVEGGDLAAELSYKMIKYANSTQAATIATELGALLPAGWTYVNAIGGSTDIVALNVMWDSLLAAVTTLCEMAGLWWHIVGKTLTIADAYGPVTHGLTPVRVSRRVDASNVVGRVYPFGAGDGMAAISMAAYTATPSAPYEVTSLLMDGATVWGVGRTDSPGYAAPGRRLRIDYKHIAPIANTTPGIIAAANTLQVAAIQHLRRYGTPVIEYTVDAVLPGVVRPLDRVALGYRDDSMLVNEVLVATEVRSRVTAAEQATVSMTLEAEARRIRSDAEVVAGAIIASRIKAAYPQIVPSWDTLQSEAEVTNGVPGALEFVYGVGVTQLASATLYISSTPTMRSDGKPQRSPTSLEYRINDTGSWVALPSTLDLTSALVDAVTKRPTASTVTVNVRGVTPATLLPNTVADAYSPTNRNTNQPVMPSVAIGAAFATVQAGTDNYVPYAATFYTGANLSSATWTSYLLPGSWAETITNIWGYREFDDAINSTWVRNYFLKFRWQDKEGWVPLYQSSWRYGGGYKHHTWETVLNVGGLASQGYGLAVRGQLLLHKLMASN